MLIYSTNVLFFSFFVFFSFEVVLYFSVEDNLSTRDKWPIPNVSFIQRFWIVSMNLDVISKGTIYCTMDEVNIDLLSWCCCSLLRGVIGCVASFSAVRYMYRNRRPNAVTFRGGAQNRERALSIQLETFTSNR